MATEFDPAKALREEIQGLTGIRATISARVVAAEMKAMEAEAEFLALQKLLGFCDAELARKKEVLAGLG